jgi:hypothetical protein
MIWVAKSQSGTLKTVYAIVKALLDVLRTDRRCVRVHTEQGLGYGDRWRFVPDALI